MKIVADKSIPYIQHYFTSLGTLQLFESNRITRASLVDADLLVVRSVTRVDRELLEGTRVRMVATATSGHDHVDTEYLQAQSIKFFHARGCNARSVAEYVLSSLFVMAEQGNFDLGSKSAGIIGCGNVGSILLAFLRTLGMTTRIYDPPRQERGEAGEYSRLDDVLDSDIISLHVPLVQSGKYPTIKLVDRDFLGRLRPGAILVNSSRGQVVDEMALLECMNSRTGYGFVLDVWESEPLINIEILRHCKLASPHIAGYSLDARLKGTRMIFTQVCESLNVRLTGIDDPELPEKVPGMLEISEFESDMDAIQMAVLASYDVRTDSATIKQMNKMDTGHRAEYFSDLRNFYPLRREFPSMCICIPSGYDNLQRKLEALGFRVKLIN